MVRTRLASLLAISALLTLAGCPEDPKAPSGGGSSSSSGGGGGGSVTCKGKPEVGKPASTFSLPSMNDVAAGKVAIEPGKVTLVDFWATWCKPCEKSFPKYQEFYVKYKSSGFEIAAVSVDGDDTKKDIKSWVKERGAKFPVGWDEGQKIADCYKPPGMPAAFLVDKKGVIKVIHQGFRGDEDAKKLEEEIKSLL